MDSIPAPSCVVIMPPLAKLGTWSIKSPDELNSSLAPTTPVLPAGCGGIGKGRPDNGPDTLPAIGLFSPGSDSRSTISPSTAANIIHWFGFTDGSSLTK